MSQTRPTAIVQSLLVLPHLQVGPQVHPFGSTPQLHTGAQLQGLHLHFFVIADLHIKVGGNHALRHLPDH
jgi:hypothetical protein